MKKTKTVIVLLFILLLSINTVASATFTLYDTLSFGGKASVTEESEISWITLSFGGKADILFDNASLSNEYPANESTGIELFPILNITVDEPQDQEFDIVWSTNATGTWTNFVVNSSVADGTYRTNFSYANESNTTYWWRVNVSDIHSEAKTYRYDNYSDIFNWYWHPERMVDGSLGTEAGAWYINESQWVFDLLDTDDDTPCPSSGFGIGKVEIRAYGWCSQPPADVWINLTPVFGGTNNGTNITWIPPRYGSQKDYSPWYDITNDVNAPASWAWSDVQNLEANITYMTNDPYVSTMYIFTIEVRVSPSYTGGETTHWTNATYHFTTANYTWGNWSDWWTFTHAHENFSAPTYFNATHWNSTAINLTWTKSDNISTTYIIKKIDSTPTNITDGTEVYNGTLEVYNDTGLGYGTHFYYAAFSYNATLNVYTSDFILSDNYTNPGIPISLAHSAKGMETITLVWEKGTNATNTTIRYSDYAYPAISTSNTSAYNDTSTSIEITGLTANTTYYFRAWSYNPDSGLLSETNVSYNTTTVGDADVPSDFTATTYNASRIELAWIPGEISTVTTVRGKSGSYPTDVTDGYPVFNGTGAATIDTGLSPVTHYYYRAWGWNGEEHSVGYVSASNITVPYPPNDFIGSISGTTLTLNWTKGNGALNTIVRNETDAYPSTPQDGYEVYNDTGITKIVYGVTGIDYYRAWSYATLEGHDLFSSYVNLVWGGLEINVYKEPNPTINITNYTVFITNQDGSETYEALDQTNPTRIDVSEVPNGEDISIQISKEGYHPRIKYLDMYENQWYSVNFYLPPDTEGGGDEDDDDYVPPDDPDNESYAESYIISIIDELNSPVQNAKVTIRAYINITNTWEDMYILITDGYGQISIDLIPGTQYKIDITEANEYQDSIGNDWTPKHIEFSDDRYKTFQILFVVPDIQPPDIEPENIVFEGYISGTNILYLNYTDSLEETLNTTITVYEINLSTGIESVFGTNTTSNVNSFQTSFSSINTSNTYKVILFYNHTTFGYQTKTLIFSGDFNPPSAAEVINALLTAIVGPHPFGWANFLIWLFLVAGMYYADERDSGKILVLLGGMFLFLNIVVGFNTTLMSIAGGAVPILFIVVGILVMWKESNRRTV